MTCGLVQCFPGDDRALACTLRQAENILSAVPAMPRVLIVTEPPVPPEPFRRGLLGLGYSVIDEIDDPSRLVKRAISIAPDVILIGTESPSKLRLAATAAVEQHAPYPILVFSADSDAQRIEQTVRHGVQSYIVDGFSARRLPALIAVARARHAAQHAAA